jgi:alpha-L-fucosidase
MFIHWGLYSLIGRHEWAMEMEGIPIPQYEMLAKHFTLNDSWGYHKADDNWKTPKTIVNNLITCAHGGGNYLLNIGPKPDGSIPEESVAILQAVGKRTGPNATAIYGTERSSFNQHVYATSHSAETRCTPTLMIGQETPGGTMAIVLPAAQRDFLWGLSKRK